MVTKMAAVMICLLLLLSGTGGRVADDYENRGRSPYNSIEEEIKDYLAESGPGREVKRQTPGGTCTCTCETKPVLSARKNFPETAALMRTAVKPDMTSGSKIKDAMETRLYQSDGDRRSKMLKADPWNYAHVLNGGNHDDDYHGNNEAADDKEDAEDKTVDTDEAESNDNWGHESRFPWKTLPDKMCYRNKCSSSRDCCMRYNVCDKSAKVCIDCWHGSNCNSELDCCQRFPYCQSSKNVLSGTTGKCVDVLKKTKED